MFRKWRERRRRLELAYLELVANRRDLAETHSAGLCLDAASMTLLMLLGFCGTLVGVACDDVSWVMAVAMAVASLLCGARLRAWLKSHRKDFGRWPWQFDPDRVRRARSQDEPPTSPFYCGAPHPNPRVHGTEFCKHRCEVCLDGRHHWVDSGFDPEDEYYGSADDPERERHNAIRATGEMNAAAHFVCNHCPTWAECDFVWELEHGGEADGREDW